MSLVPSRLRAQAGFSLIEVMVAMLVFGAGVLGIARLQSVAVQETGTSAFRSTASLLAKSLVARMWMSDRTPATLTASFSSASAGTGFVSWLATVTDSRLPGVVARPPVVTVTPVAGGGTTAVGSSLVSVTVYWKAPGDAAYHYFVETAQLK